MSPHAAAAALRDERDLALTLIGPLAGGELGAHEVRRPNGRRGVLKVFSAEERAAVKTSLTLLERLRGRGYPAPPVVFTADLPDALVVVLDWSAGAVRERVDHALVNDILAAVALQGEAAAGVSAGEAWGRFVIRALREGFSPQEGFCLHAPLLPHDRRTARLLDHIIEIGHAVEPEALPHEDVMHGDLHHHNLLVDRGRVNAIIDWDSARPGDRAFDLVTLGFCSAALRSSPRRSSVSMPRPLRFARRPSSTPTSRTSLCARSTGRFDAARVPT